MPKPSVVTSDDWVKPAWDRLDETVTPDAAAFLRWLVEREPTPYLRRQKQKDVLRWLLVDNLRTRERARNDLDFAIAKLRVDPRLREEWNRHPRGKAIVKRAKREVKNLLRRSMARGRGRPRGSAADLLYKIESELIADAPDVRAGVRRIWRRLSEETLTDLMKELGATPYAPSIRRLLCRANLDPARVVAFILTQKYRERLPGLRESDVARVLAQK